MLFKAFLGHYRTLGDGFLSTFSHPFLVEEGRLEFEGGTAQSSRQVFYLQSDGDPLLIGRKPGADFRIPNRNVSGRHAQIFPPTVPGRPWEIADLNSSNGTFLNGEQLPPHERRPLRDEDTLGFGPMLTYVFLEPTTFLEILRREAGREKRAAESRKEKPLGGSRTLVSDDVGLSPSGVPSAVAEPEAGLFLFCDPLDPIPLEPGKRLVIGRSAAHADVVLPHPQVSRRHAEIECRPDGVYVRDLHSANGITLGGVRLGTGSVQLPPGHVLGIADFRLTVKGKLPEVQFDTFVLPPASTKRKLIRGNLDKVSLDQVLIGIEEKQKTGRLEVHAPDLQGFVAFRAGRPWTAGTNTGLRGDDAVRRLVGVSEGRFTIDPNARPEGERDVERPFSEIVLEAFFDT